MFENLNYHHGSLDISINMDRFNEQYEQAQKALDNAVLTDCTEYVPFREGELRKSGVRGTVIGSGEVAWLSPYARMLYYGKVMVDPVTNAAGFIDAEGQWKSWNRSKVVSTRDITYHTPGTGAFWFESAKSSNKDSWVALVKRIAGGG